MKHLFFKISLLLFTTLISGVSLAQEDDKFGDNPDQCKRDLSLYREFVLQKSYIDAYPAMRRVLNNCPKSSKQVYIDAPKVYGAIIKKEKDPTNKQAYIDTLMQVYDQRIENFGQEGNVLGRKGNDLYKLNEDAYEEAYGYMIKSLELCGAKAQPAVLQQLMVATTKMYKEEKIDAGQVVKNFSDISANLTLLQEKYADKASTLGKLKIVEENVGKLFIATGAGSCEVLINHFTPKFEATPEDAELLSTITKYLDKGGCTDSKLFFDASIELDKISPSAQSAYNIARMAAGKKEFSKAADFYKKAIDREEDDELKAKYYYELAAVSTGSPAAARGYALKAASLKSGWGDPYILIGKLYAASSSSCGENKLQQGAVFWLAVDMFAKAKAVDPSVSGTANSLIAQYKVYFPGKEDAFAYNVTEGSNVEIGCWINESTKARF
jgi:tetratricopeptide (TPR) repeat protein